MNVVGLDLSLTSTGLASIDFDDLRPDPTIELGNIGTKGKRSDTWEDRSKRLTFMADSIVEWTLAAPEPDLVVIEAPSYGSQGGSTHDRSGLWWMVTAGLMEAGHRVVPVAPRTRAKYATGHGGSKKDVVMAHVVERYTDSTSDRIRNDDQADALVLAAMGMRHLGLAIERMDMPEDNLAAMKAVQW